MSRAISALLPDPLDIFSCIAEGTGYGSGKAPQVILQYVVNGTGTQRENGPLLADRPRQEYKWHCGCMLLRNSQRRHSIKLRQGKVGQYYCRCEFMQPGDQAGFGLDPSPHVSDACTLELMQCQLDVDDIVLDKEYANYLRGLITHSFRVQRV